MILADGFGAIPFPDNLFRYHGAIFTFSKNTFINSFGRFDVPCRQSFTEEYDHAAIKLQSNELSLY